MLDEGGDIFRNGFGLVPYAMRPHNQSTSSKKAGKVFEDKEKAGRVKDDAGRVFKFARDGPVLYLEDGEAWLFANNDKRKLR